MKKWTTKRLLLRSVKISDAESIQRYAADFELAKTTLNIPHPYPENGGSEFINKAKRAENEGDLILFALEKEEEFIGLINVTINQEHNWGEIGYWVGKPFWGQGFGTEAARFMLHYSFTQLKLKKVQAKAYSNNIASRKIIEKMGLRYKKTLSNDRFRFGVYGDTACYELLADEYKRVRND